MKIKTHPTSNYYSTPRTTGPYRYVPFGSLNSQYYIEQDYVVHYQSYKQGQLNSLFISKPGYYLVEESAPQEVGNGLLKYTRIYAPIFSDDTDWEQYAMTYPGLSGTVGVYARAALIMNNEPSRLDSKFFLIGVSLQDKTPFGLIKTYADIQVLNPLPILTAAGGLQTTYQDAEAIALTSPELFPDAVSDSTLTETLYVAKVTANTFMVVERSMIKPWKGNLYQRITRYVQAR